MKIFARLALVILVLAVVVIPAAAQGGDPGADQKQLTQELWCPICNGIRLDVCEQKVCEQMREQIAIDLKAGKTTEQIKLEFIEFYGPSVLGRPRVRASACWPGLSPWFCSWGVWPPS